MFFVFVFPVDVTSDNNCMSVHLKCMGVREWRWWLIYLSLRPSVCIQKGGQVVSMSPLYLLCFGVLIPSHLVLFLYSMSI